jgi:hypothetical protein
MSTSPSPFCWIRLQDDGTCKCQSFGKIDEENACLIDPTNNDIMSLFYAEVTIALLIHTTLMLWSLILFIKITYLNLRSSKELRKSVINLKTVSEFN